MDRYTHLFFDLDHTLWDFDTNSKKALEELFTDHLNPLNMDFEGFHRTYLEINDNYWAQYRIGRVTKKELRIGRFRDTLHRFGMVDEDLSSRLADQYIQRSPYQTKLFPDTIETLDALKSKGYEMHIITNGFEEIQHIKITQSGLAPYFDAVITSEMVAQRKPHHRIFQHAMDSTGAEVSSSIMIGDNLEADIEGAKRFGMDQVYFNPKGVDHDSQPTYEIQEISELTAFL